MFFEDWTGILRVLAVGSMTYASLILILRISGKRTLSKWNAFDFVVTIALGSMTATIILSRDVALVEGVAAFTLLIALQYLITSLSVRSDSFAKLVKSEPTLLLYRGTIKHKALDRMRVTESEVRAALRSAGIASYEDAGAVVLETDGSFSVLEKIPDGHGEAMSDVAGICSQP